MSKPVLTLEAFADWAEKQPADKAYQFTSLANCACAQYARSLGIDWLSTPVADFWVHANHIAADWGGDRGYTFGALASRLRAIPSPADERRQP